MTGTTRVNVASGEALTVLSAPGDRVQRFGLALDAVVHGPPAHRHRVATERFSVTEGELALRLGRSWRSVSAGDSVLVPAGAVHTYANRSGAPVLVDVEIDPGGSMRDFFDDLYQLAEQGALTPTGGLRPIQAARLLHRHPGALEIIGPPAFVQPALWWALSRFESK